MIPVVMSSVWTSPVPRAVLKANASLYAKRMTPLSALMVMYTATIPVVNEANSSRRVHRPDPVKRADSLPLASAKITLQRVASMEMFITMTLVENEARSPLAVMAVGSVMRITALRAASASAKRALLARMEMSIGLTHVAFERGSVICARTMNDAKGGSVSG